MPTADGQPKTECLASLADAAKQQDELVKLMREILRHMVKWEGYQEALNLLREVLKAQRNVNDQTIKEYQRRIQKIFE
jgi:DNA-binding transcriptional MocR family regulator